LIFVVISAHIASGSPLLVRSDTSVW